MAVVALVQAQPTGHTGAMVMAFRYRGWRLIRMLIFGALAVGAVYGAAPARAESAAVILMYHRFGEENLPSTNIRLEQFVAHIEELTVGGYTVLPVPDIIAALRTGTSLPDRSIGITIDDAFTSVYHQAWPRGASRPIKGSRGSSRVLGASRPLEAICRDPSRPLDAPGGHSRALEAPRGPSTP